MTVIDVDPGICGFVSRVSVVSEDGQMCKVRVATGCESVKALVDELGELDSFDVAFKNFSENPVYLAASKHYKHAACPLPSAIIKAVEIECHLALPKEVRFTPKEEE
ncbi:hypothetical protein MASR2M78_19180 [Treponema sp.]